MAFVPSIELGLIFSPVQRRSSITWSSARSPD